MKDDIVYSAYSMFLAFSLLYIGSKNETKQQLSNVFGFSSVAENHFVEFMSRLMKGSDKESSVAVEIANGLWGAENFKFKDEYLERINNWNVE